MSNEPAWITRIDRLVGKASIQFNDLLRELRRALEHEHELEEDNKYLRARLREHEGKKYTRAEPLVPLSPLALPRNEKPKRKEQDDAEH